MMTKRIYVIRKKCSVFCSQYVVRKFNIVLKKQRIHKTFSYTIQYINVVKVSLFQNVLLVSLLGPKYQRKNLTISALKFEKWSNQQNKGTFL